jgi:hypothetical protein|tara:strand:- start:1107 stop:1868 length:762 start_codon:yes stop_codon:yes gene_type:complete
MTRFLTLALFLAITTSPGCMAHTPIPVEVRHQISTDHQGRRVELRQSCYFGDLYDDNSKWLLSALPFENVHHIVDMDGKPIHPDNQRGIIPAGTKFIIEDIEFPDQMALATRMLMSPRYHTWVYLRAVETLGKAHDLNSVREHFIILLPMDLAGQQDVESHINQLLAPAGRVSAWLQERRPSVRVAIEHKDILPGMTREELIAAMGEPQAWIAEQGKAGLEMVAWYPRGEAWLRRDEVIRVANPRKMTTQRTD